MTFHPLRPAFERMSRPALRVLSVLVPLALALPPAALATLQDDPVDRTVEHTVTSHDESFAVTSGEVHAQSWIRLENLGADEIHGAKFQRADRDWSTIDSILASIVRPGMSNAEKARAIWQFAREARYHWLPPSSYFTETDDPVKYFNFYGYGLCSDTSYAMARLYDRIGFPVRIWNPGMPAAHLVPEVFYDGAWHMYDGDLDAVYLMRDNETVAGVSDLIDDPDLVRRAGPKHAHLVDIYARTPRTAVFSWWYPPVPPIDLGVSLRPREQLTFYWEPRGRARVSPDDYQPPIYANAELASRLLASDADYARWLSDAQAMEVAIADSQSAFTASIANQPGTLAYQVRSAYPIIQASVALDVIAPAADDVVEIFASRGPSAVGAPTLVWSSAGQPARGRLPLTLDLTTVVSPLETDATYAFTLYARVRSPRPQTTGISGFDVLSILQAAPQSLPAIERGSTTFRYRDRSTTDTTLRVTQAWRELPNAHRPAPPVLTTSTVDAAQPFTMTWQQAVDADNDPMRQYQIKICADAACASPLSGIFDTEIWTQGPGPDGVPGTGDDWPPGPTVSWRVDQHDWFIPGRTYYWTVRAQDASLLWSDFSTPQPFTVTTSQVEPPFRYVLAEGATGAFFDTELAITNPNDQDAPVSLRFVTELGTVVSRALVVPALARRTLRLGEDPELAAATFSIEAVSQANIPLAIARTMFWGDDRSGGHSDTALREESTRWYFAEGAQGFFNTYVLVGNLRTTSANVLARFMTEQREVFERRYVVPPGSRLTIDAGSLPELMNQSFAIDLVSNAPIVAERAMYFGPGWPGGHASAGAPKPSTTWFHAEGATGSYFTTFILVGNPNDEAVALTFDFMTELGQRVRSEQMVAAHSRFTLNVADAHPALAHANVATSLTASRPVVAERVTYWPAGPATWQDATGSFGSSTTATRWAVAEGRIGGPRGYQTYVLLANGTSREAVVRLRALPAQGGPLERQVTVPPNSRFNAHLDGLFPELTGQELGVRLDVVNEVPISVEWSLYWNAGGVIWAGGASALGVPLP